VIFFVDIAEKEHEPVRRFGFVPTGDNSWSPLRRRDQQIPNFLRKCGLDFGEDKSVTRLEVQGGLEVGSLEEYLAGLAGDLKAKISSSLPKDASFAIVLNLMPFFLSPTRIDKLARDFLSRLSEGAPALPAQVLLLVRNIDWIVRSIVFQEMRQEGRIAYLVTGIDVRCYGSHFHPGSAPTAFELDRTGFREILACNEKEVYRALVYETNTYIGHYALPHSHVRTHYDLKDFITRDDVWEYLLTTVNELLSGGEKVYVLGTGIEHAAVCKLGEQLKSRLNERHIEFEYLPTPASFENVRMDWSAQFDATVVVTDIVNTGISIQPLVHRLMSTNTNKRTIHIFAIATMQNSAKEVGGVPISSGLTIRRDFYGTKAEQCPLCQLLQPLTQVKKVEDFRRIDASQLTPLDFWEIVKDAKAFVRNEQDLQGRHFAFRVDTVSVVKRYRRWLRNVIEQRYEETWGKAKPDVICTVAEVPGETFAELAREAIGAKRMERIPRDILRRVTPGGVSLGGTKPYLRRGERVLLADDGMNFGNTMRMLIGFCLASGAVPLGAIVLDNRLDPGQTEPIRRLMGSGQLIALYSWPARTAKL
jgi:adenine/guanine phosphoribosyltransferase-like PRPP-binding protein